MSRDDGNLYQWWMGETMSYREAANAAYTLAFDEGRRVAEFGLSLLSKLAASECYSARIYMMRLHQEGGIVEEDFALAQVWAARARELHSILTDADDLCEAGRMCNVYGPLFDCTMQDALELWEKAVLAGSGLALYDICDATRAKEKGTPNWIGKLLKAAESGVIQAMVEYAEQPGVRDTEQALHWLRAAYALGSLRAGEMLEPHERPIRHAENN